MTRNSHPEVFLGKVVLKICSKFIGEHPCRTAISSNFIEIALRHRRSPVTLLHIFRATFPRNTSRWLLLNDLFVTQAMKQNLPIHVGKFTFLLVSILHFPIEVCWDKHLINRPCPWSSYPLGQPNSQFSSTFNVLLKQSCCGFKTNIFLSSRGINSHVGTKQSKSPWKSESLDIFF